MAGAGPPCPLTANPFIWMIAIEAQGFIQLDDLNRMTGDFCDLSWRQGNQINEIACARSSRDNWARTLAHGAQAAAVDLGTAAAFGVLGSSTVTNTGVFSHRRRCGGFPGNRDHWISPRELHRNEHAGDAVAATAQGDALTAYNVAAGLASHGQPDWTGFLAALPSRRAFTPSPRRRN